MTSDQCLLASAHCLKALANQRISEAQGARDELRKVELLHEASAYNVAATMLERAAEETAE